MEQLRKVRPGAMQLHHRSTEPGDLDACADVLFGKAADLDRRGRFLTMWRELIKTRTMISAVIEDRNRRPQSRIIGFGASVFVKDEFAQQVKADERLRQVKLVALTSDALPGSAERCRNPS